MLRNFAYTIAQSDEGNRLDKVLLDACPSVTRKSLARAFDSGAVLFDDGSAASKGALARAGMVLRIAELLEKKDERAAACAGFLDTVFEDNFVLGFNKPAGQNCHPVLPEENDTLVNAMLCRYPETRGIGGDAMMPALIHRIDSGTSGLVLAARTQSSFDFIRSQFTRHEVKKIYLVEVEGIVSSPGGISGYLAHASKGEGMMREVGIGGAVGKLRAMKAETFFRPLKRRGGNTLLEVTIFTGVTHQIRCQLAGFGHPVAGDVLYGAKSLAGESGHRLHSYSAVFRHPALGVITVTAEKCPFRK